MEALLLSIADKAYYYYIIAAAVGGVASWVLNRRVIVLDGRSRSGMRGKDIGLADILIAVAAGWVAATYLIDPIMDHFYLVDVMWGLGLGFLAGYWAIPLLAKVEAKIKGLMT